MAETIIKGLAKQRLTYAFLKAVLSFQSKPRRAIFQANGFTEFRSAASNGLFRAGAKKIQP